MSSLSVCMIVKDEEESLPACLKSIEGLADQVVVVDTGSSDQTVEVANRFGTEVHFFAWTDSFSEARNRSLELARCDWILILDADDEILREDIPALKELITAGGKEAYYLRTINMLGSERPEIELRYPTLRLFRNRTEYRYSGRIHESVVPSIIRYAGNNAIGMAPVRVNHYGYLKRNVVSKNKARRNLGLLEKQHAEQGEDSFLLYNMGVEYLRLGENERALQCFTRAEANIDPRLSYAPSLARKKAECLNIMQRHGEALEYLKKMTELYPDYTDLHYFKGMLYLQLNNYPAAIAAFEQCLRLGEAPARYVSEAGMAGFWPSFSLANIYMSTNEPEKALQYYHRALKCNPNNLLPLCKIIQLLLATQGCEKALNYLSTYYNLANAAANQAAAKILLTEGYPREALSFLKEAAQSGATGAEYTQLLGECLLLSLEMKAAESELRKIPEDCAEYAQAQRNLVLLYWIAEEYDKAAALLENWPEGTSKKMYSALHKSLSGTADDIPPKEIVTAEQSLLLELLARCLCAGQTKLVETVLRMLPVAVEIQLQIGKLYHKYGNTAGAENHLVAALAEKHDSEATLLLADILIKKQELQRAEEICRRAFSVDGANIGLYLKLEELHRCRAEAALHKLPDSEIILKALREAGLPRLSLCMIVKDEEESLPRCLKSVEGFVDEIIVVDTGCRDTSPEIARQFGARIFNFPWNGDFSEARNFSLNQATGDWILILDADEEIYHEDAPKLRALLGSDAEGFCFQLINYFGNESGLNFMRDLGCRLFRNRPRYRFRRSLHEQVIDEIIAEKGVNSVKVANVRIRHYGYLTPTVVKKNKSARNREIISRAIQENPENKFLNYSFAVELLNNGQSETALTFLERAYQPGTSFASDVILKKILCLKEMNLYEKTLAEIDHYLDIYPRFTDLIFIKGEICFMLNRYQEAAACFQHCLSLGDAPANYCGSNGVGGFKACYLLGQIYEKLSEPEKAVVFYKQAVKDNPKFHLSLYALARVLRLNHSATETVQLLHDSFTFTGPDAVLLLADILMSTHDYQLSLEHIDQCTAGEERTAVRKAYMKGIAFACMERDEEAVSAWSEVSADSSYHVPVLSWQYLIAIGSGNGAQARHLLDVLAKADAKTERVYRKIHSVIAAGAAEAWNDDEKIVIAEACHRLNMIGKTALVNKLIIREI